MVDFPPPGITGRICRKSPQQMKTWPPEGASFPEELCLLAASSDVALWGLFAPCDGNLVGGMCRHSSLVVQCGQTGRGRAQDDLSLCGQTGRGRAQDDLSLCFHGCCDDFHQESLAPSRPAIYVHQEGFEVTLLLRPPHRWVSARLASARASRIHVCLTAVWVPSHAFSCYFGRVVCRFR